MKGEQIIGVVLPLAGIWFGYFVIHSLLASLTVKQWVAQRHPAWLRGYRLFFNGTAILLLIPPVWATYALRGPLLWQWGAAGHGMMILLNLLALAGFVWSLRWYDGGEFFGTRQWGRGGSVRDVAEPLADQLGEGGALRISPLHRFVRHPWYSLGLLFVWSHEMDLALLTGAIAITLYFAIGSRLEERKLIAWHGETYRRYQKRVPALIPLPWRHLDADEALALEREAERGRVSS